MRITLFHPAHTAIGSRVPRENLPPFGLLCLGGPLIDAGYEVALVNADLAPLSTAASVRAVLETQPQVVMIGHSGSTSAHPEVVQVVRALKAAAPGVLVIYGGVYPTYHWREVLEETPGIDVIVRGEGERTAVDLMRGLNAGTWRNLPGLAYWKDGAAHATRPAAVIADLDRYRVGWELIDFAAHSYWGGKRAVILQFSRGCPHLCTYCGQRGFWTKWRHRDPVAFAREIAWLHREHGVELINLADENPTSSRRQWKAFLEAMVAENVPVTIIGSTRADDIVRDADLMPLYKEAGCLRFLLGLEGTDEATLAAVKKGGSRAKDREAIHLLRAHGMIGLCTFAVGFEEETDADYWRLMRHLLRYDPDQVMSIYATPHRWTPFFEASKDRRVIQPDQRLWDYKHQVLDCPRVPPWRVFLWVKAIEMVLQLRPRALWRVYFHPDPEIRHAMRWYTAMGRRVVWREVLGFIRQRRGDFGSVASYWKGTEPLREASMDRMPPQPIPRPKPTLH